MNIAIETTAWHNSRGYGRHARSLLTALLSINKEDKFTFIVDAHNEQYPLPQDADVRHLTTSKPVSVAASSDSYRSVKDMWSISQILSSNEFDVVFFPTVYSYVPLFSRSKKVVMIHDVIAEKFPQLTVPNRRARLFWQLKVALGRWQADAIATVSEYSRQQLISHFRIPPEKISVVGEASDPVFRVLENPSIPSRLHELGIPRSGRLIVYVGGFGPHKNLGLLVNSFNRIVSYSGFEDIFLIFVGEYQKEVFYSEYNSLSDQIEAKGISDRVFFTGYLSDEEVVQLFNMATVLVLPSLMEGFGLPAVEAAACGCPVIATRESPLPQLLGEAGLFVDPRSPEELEAALFQVLISSELRLKMRDEGLLAAQSLTWESAARQLNDLLHTVAC